MSDEQDQIPKTKFAAYVFSIIILFYYHVFWNKDNSFSTALKYVEHERLSSAHSPATRRMHLRYS